ncbi:hypothetical protein GUJ93_ZPchr0181g29100 [Zizania palustris]|uniref:Uncharacterized protein n=1 Tax=Zizania palustris TaxID=103762 RepID=A0A8J5RBF5_ZIZPA|nr:hypothetical protein GUJ93_ZPchr0181g29100 [Zizania palustris]
MAINVRLTLPSLTSTNSLRAKTKTKYTKMKALTVAVLITMAMLMMFTIGYSDHGASSDGIIMAEQITSAANSHASNGGGGIKAGIAPGRNLISSEATSTDSVGSAIGSHRSMTPKLVHGYKCTLNSSIFNINKLNALRAKTKTKYTKMKALTVAVLITMAMLMMFTIGYSDHGASSNDGIIMAEQITSAANSHASNGGSGVKARIAPGRKLISSEATSIDSAGSVIGSHHFMTPKDYQAEMRKIGRTP